MRLAALLSVYFFSVFAGGALLAPWLQSAFQWGAGHLPFLDGIAYQPFHRYVNRCFMVIAIFGLWPLGRIGNLSWNDIGWSKSDRNWKHILIGLVIGLGSLFIPAVVCLLVGGRELHWPAESALVFKHFGNAVGAAVAVSILEETVFRGVLFGIIRKYGSIVAATCFSSAVYALVHFFEKAVHEGEVYWNSGLALLPRMLRDFGAIESLIPALPNLFVAGMILALAFRVSGSLCLSVGIHAGWIFWLKTFNFFTQAQPTGNTWLWGSHKLIDGWFPTLVLLATLYLLHRKNFFIEHGTNEAGEPNPEDGGRAT